MALDVALLCSDGSSYTRNSSHGHYRCISPAAHSAVRWSSCPLAVGAAFASRPGNSWTHGAVHFWAPTFKWGISIANIADFAKPPEKISYPQQVAVACTGVVWSRYSMVITPKNWNLFSVNVAMAGTGLYQLSRKIRQDYFSDEKDTAPSLEG
ncbi:mitochondrial pyruvate carrier 4-like [Panicum miliaceum]|uniref:Mitochondrial pyruvate carrier n=1 Tax=Panicum miliaceum TaxID=4540 RepID=A0A3L6PAN4_PANMI|nr:mitochondrial pyruvate carrier 4-like [Panicum miliaceum]